MSARKATEETATPAATDQWHLTHIQLVNWGTFCGYQHLRVRDRSGDPARVSMITGESGTGKSTLFDAKTAVLMRGTARFNTASIDCLPLGDLAETMATIVMGSPDSPEFSLACTSPAGSMSFSTEEIRAVLGDVSLAEPEVIRWINESLREEIEPILGGIMR